MTKAVVSRSESNAKRVPRQPPEVESVTGRAKSMEKSEKIQRKKDIRMNAFHSYQLQRVLY